MYNDTRCWLSASHDVVVYFNIRRGVVSFEAHIFWRCVRRIRCSFRLVPQKDFLQQYPTWERFRIFRQDIRYVVSGRFFRRVLLQCAPDYNGSFLKCEMDSYYIDDQAQHIDNNRYAVHQEERTVFRKQMFDMVYKSRIVRCSDESITMVFASRTKEKQFLRCSRSCSSLYTSGAVIWMNATMSSNSSSMGVMLPYGINL